MMDFFFFLSNFYEKETRLTWFMDRIFSFCPNWLVYSKRFFYNADKSTIKFFVHNVALFISFDKFQFVSFFFFFPDVLAQIELEIEIPFPLFSCKYLKCYRTFVSKMGYSASKNMRRLDSQIWGLFHPF